ncbi:MAG: alpha/beta hydrolase [Fibrobacter sp.]|nr:alpha/beta hydrolase [Fibrobacter sp.]
MERTMKLVKTFVFLIPIVFVHFSLALGLPQCGRPENTIHEDPFLGKPFVIYPFEAGDSAQYHATVVRYCGPGAGNVVLAGSRDSVKADSSVIDSAVGPQAVNVRKAAVLYIHGFNDYFFQRQLAEKMDSAGYVFYAIDLHKYGRSYRDGETMGELRDIREYYAELDTAIAFIRNIEGDSVPLVMLGHSTGGLITSLYAADRDNGADFAAIVLNSPFLEMNYGWPMRKVVVPVFSAVGALLPGLGIPRSINENYDKSLLKKDYGEWEYDSKFKVRGSLPVDFGWLRAIHQGHVRVQAGLRLVPPVLVMHSGCSYHDDDWSEEYTHCDGVLDVEHIREYGRNLGPSVQLEEIEGGLHDLFLSRLPARDNAYRKMFEFLDSRL